MRARYTGSVRGRFVGAGEPTLSEELVDPAPWMQQGVCRDVEDKDLFFPAKPVPTTRAERTDLQTARQVCNACPVQLTCLEYAMDQPGLQGIWGGVTDKERQDLRIARHRTRLNERRQLT